MLYLMALPAGGCPEPGTGRHCPKEYLCLSLLLAWRGSLSSWGPKKEGDAQLTVRAFRLLVYIVCLGLRVTSLELSLPCSQIRDQAEKRRTRFSFTSQDL